MKTNIGTIDRAIRLILGVVIVGAGIYFKSFWGAIGLVFILSALIGWCILYKIFGISTGCKKKK